MTKPIETVVTPWREIVVVCAKCSRKLDGGFGPDGADKLRSALKDGLREAGRRRQVRVVEGKCFGICPKKAVVVVGSAAPGALLVVPAGTAVAEVLRRVSPAPATLPPPR